MVEPGVYKVKSFGRFHRMTVFVEKGKLMYSIAACPPRPVDDLEDHIEIIGPIHHLDPVLHARLTIKWKDQYQDEFEEEATNTSRFRQILDSIPDVLNRLKDNPWRPKE